MNEVRYMAPTGMLGSGYSLDSFERGLSWEPHFIACDSGTTDFGPYYLGSSQTYFSHHAMKRDIRFMLRAARARRIPLLIGSAGTSGSNHQVATVQAIVRELALEEDLHFRLASIESEPPKSYLTEMYRKGKVLPLENAPVIDESTFQSASHVVAMAGVEPLQAALGQGADVIICGRSSDTSVFAAIPLLRGMPSGPSWHAAKIMECGAGAVVQRSHPDPMFAWIREDHFVVEPPNPAFRCTPTSVASHSLYENGSPVALREPSGIVKTDDCTYTAISDRAVKVYGSAFDGDVDYTVKLEGAELVGYQSVVVGGIRDSVIIQQLDSWLDGVRTAISSKFESIYGQSLVYTLGIRRYGVDAVMGRLETALSQPLEVGIVLEVTAIEQALASELANIAAHIALHFPVPEYSGLITTLALPYSPPSLQRGPVYRYCLNHVLKLDDPLEPFKLNLMEV